MAVVGSSIVPGGGLLTPTLTREVIAVANTEQSYALPTSTKSYTIYNDGSTIAKIAFAVGESATDYRTLYPGCHICRDGIASTAALTVYFQTAKVGDTIEFETWT